MAYVYVCAQFEKGKKKARSTLFCQKKKNTIDNPSILGGVKKKKKADNGFIVACVPPLSCSTRCHAVLTVPPIVK